MGFPTVHLRQRWVISNRGRVRNSRHVPKDVQPIDDRDDSKNPSPNSNLLLVCDILLVGALGKAIVAGWINMSTATESREDTILVEELPFHVFVFMTWFFKVMMCPLFMWLFTNLFLGWFYMSTTSMPVEYGGGDSAYKMAEFFLIPTMLCMLAVAYNDPVCIITFDLPRAAWSRNSTNCGHASITGETVTAMPGFYPAQPCAASTWGSCVFGTIARISFHCFSLVCVEYVSWNLDVKDLQLCRKMLGVFRWTQLGCLCSYSAVLYLVVLASDDMIGLASALIAGGVAVNYIPLLWMCGKDVANKKHHCPPLDSIFLKARLQTVFKVVLSNMLLVGIQAGFHNGLFVVDGKYTIAPVHNIMPFVTTFLVWGTKMLYFDSAIAIPLYGPNMHAVDAGHIRATTWIFLQLVAVPCAGMVTQSLVAMIQANHQTKPYKKQLEGIAICFLLLIFAALAAVHKKEGDARVRQIRRVILRCILAFTLLAATLLTSPDSNTQIWLSMFSLPAIGLLERVLDRDLPSSCWLTYKPKDESDPSSDYKQLSGGPGPCPEAWRILSMDDSLPSKLGGEFTQHEGFRVASGADESDAAVVVDGNVTFDDFDLSLDMADASAGEADAGDVGDAGV